jgi:predicted glycosyltransferase
VKVLIVVTHLLGTGHLSRALTLGRAFAAAGHDVMIASGGMPAAQLDHGVVTFVQLPPLRADGTNFTRLLDTDGGAASANWLARRRAALGAALNTHAPDILITELFPFVRRILSDEFLALLRAARARPRPPVVLASIRDILAPPSKPAKAARTDDIIARYYDAVLVHSDPLGTPLEQSWPVSGRLAQKLRYTGYVAPAPAAPHPDGAGKAEILVSAGGGAVGTALFETALAAAALSPDLKWRLLVGGGTGENNIETLRAKAGNSIVEPARADFRAMLYHAAASVSMCGYNTTLDLLQAGTAAVLVPFDAGNEVEQTLRAQSLAALPAITVRRAAGLTPGGLRDAVRAVIRAPGRPATGLRFDGAAQTVALACGMARDMTRKQAST